MPGKTRINSACIAGIRTHGVVAAMTATRKNRTRANDDSAVEAASMACRILLGGDHFACHTGIDGMDQPIEIVRPAVLTYLHRVSTDDTIDVDTRRLACELLREHYTWITAERGPQDPRQRKLWLDHQREQEARIPILD